MAETEHKNPEEKKEDPPKTDVKADSSSAPVEPTEVVTATETKGDEGKTIEALARQIDAQITQAQEDHYWVIHIKKIWLVVGMSLGLLISGLLLFLLW